MKKGELFLLWDLERSSFSSVFSVVTCATDALLMIPTRRSRSSQITADITDWQDYDKISNLRLLQASSRHIQPHNNMTISILTY